ncbi:MAG TPA: recombinase family protein [Chitinophagaceae bacterium]|nr:recombinase family protein [Chitinophagaceae bacterium]
MNAKIQSYHLQKMACIYLRQSTMSQVLHNQESTERQYALQQTALQYGWDATRIRIMDGDLGKSGSNTTNREDFKSLVAEVSMGTVGAIFVLEASRLSRSSADWNRLLELCSLTQTLIIDQDGCYDPSQFNDQLLLGLKGTMSQAELHLIRARLHGAKVNKAKKGELRFPIPVGYIYDEEGNISLDPDQQVGHVIRLLFNMFKVMQTAYAVVHHFGSNHIQFPKRSYGGKWKGKLLWGKLTHERVLNILKHPFYAGVYTFGRYKSVKKINSQGEIVTTLKRQPMDQWTVMIKDHHYQYITYDEFEHNVQQLHLNKANIPDNLLAGPPREGLTLLQGLLVCGVCGRRMTIRYAVNNSIVPTYECNWRKRQGLTGCSCFAFRADIVDPIIAQKVIDILTPANISIAVQALSEMEKRNASLDKNWQMSIQRCQYQVDLAQRRFEQVDPANRLVAASLEKNWNLELEKLSLATNEYQQYQKKKEVEFPPYKRKEIISLATQIPLLWSKTANIKDKKRIIRLLISDITVTKDRQTKTLFLHVRWQGGPLQQFQVNLPLNAPDKTRYPQAMIEKIRSLTMQYGDDKKTIALLNEQGVTSAMGKPFSKSMITWIRYKHKIRIPLLKSENEFTVDQVKKMFNISVYMVYYWIDRKYVIARKKPDNTFLIKITPSEKVVLGEKIKTSYKADSMLNHFPQS